MEKLLKEYIELMKQLRAANADLYVKFVEFVRKAQQEFAQQYDLDGFGWIGATGWPPGLGPPSKPPKLAGKPPRKKR
ncbi:MAG: hypothetical protein E6J66_08990 [Deltaproteobacteria bacterium]|nr:MAG: hypothetical protein E6J66_08990 [Deltaproteobacteria bacterium]